MGRKLSQVTFNSLSIILLQMLHVYNVNIAMPIAHSLAKKKGGLVHGPGGGDIVS